jgi:hypothetical protein
VMPDKWLRLAALLTLTVGVAIGLVRARPYDDPALYTFLTPPHDCAAPCFLGVQPGITPLEEAVTILEANDWIAEVEAGGRFHDLLWSGTQPDFIDDDALNYFMIRAGVVDSIRLRTRLRLGDVVGLLGRPDDSFSWLTGSGSGVFYAMIYTQLGVEVSGFAPCPALRRDMWQMPVEIRLQRQNILLAYEGAGLQLLHRQPVDCT